MANIDNLKVPTSEEARERGKKGGIASGKSRAMRKTFKEAINSQLDDNTMQELIKSIIKEAKKGNTKAFEILRDTVGEKPTDKINLSGELTYEQALKKVSDKNEY